MTKQHMISLLFEEYKQAIKAKELRTLGVDIGDIIVDNYSIILDIIGFPKNNTPISDILEEDADEEILDKATDAEGRFSREWLYEYFYDLSEGVESTKPLEVGLDGLVAPKYDKEEVKEILSEHVDWLYNEYRSLGNK